MGQAPWIGVITNPNSRKNQGAKDRAKELARVVGEHGVVRETQRTDEIADVVDEFRALGVRYWVTDGGDGSLHWLLNVALAKLGDLADVKAAIPANGGTIDFVARYAGLKGRAEHLLAGLVERHRRAEPLTHVKVPSLLLVGQRVRPDGTTETVRRLGFAAALAGIGNGFFEKYYAAGARRGSREIAKVMGLGGASFVLKLSPLGGVAPRAWVEYGDVLRAVVEAEVEVDGRRLPYRRLTAFHVGAFPINLGDVVRVFGAAKGGDLHAMVGELSDGELLANVPRIVAGRPVVGDGLYDGPARVVRATALGGRPFRPVLDGEILEPMASLEVHPGPAIEIPSLDARPSLGERVRARVGRSSGARQPESDAQ